MRRNCWILKCCEQETKALVKARHEAAGFPDRGWPPCTGKATRYPPCDIHPQKLSIVDATLDTFWEVTRSRGAKESWRESGQSGH